MLDRASVPLVDRASVPFVDRASVPLVLSLCGALLLLLPAHAYRIDASSCSAWPSPLVRLLLSGAYLLAVALLTLGWLGAVRAASAPGSSSSLSRVLAGGLLLPWHGSVTLPAVLLAARDVRLYAGQSGRVQQVSVAEGANVDTGEVLLTLDNPDLEHRIATLTQQLAVLEAVTATHALDARLNDRTPIERQELQRVATELESARAQAARLTIRAPWPGRIAELAPDLRAGSWLGAAEPLLTLVGDGAPKAVGYVAEADLRRIERGAPARFHASDRLSGLPLVVTRIEPSTAPRLPELALASPLGGELAARLDEQQNAIPIEARYRIELQPKNAALPAPMPPRAGEVVIETPAEALIVRLWRELAGAVVRESGW